MPFLYAFGDFVLNPAERTLVHKDQLVPVTPKVFDALLLLVQNAGRLVEKEEFMRRLWPDTFVGDDTLAQNISLLRKALTDGSDGAALIVTVPRLGYRFAGAVREEVASTVNNGQEQPWFEAGRITEAPRQETKRVTRFRIHPAALISAAILIGTLTGLATYFLLAKPAIPRLTRTTQITRSGRVDPWGGLVTDGARLYFLEREGDHWNLVQTSIAGGQSQIVAAPLRNTRIFAISPDHADFLVANFPYRDTEMPLWTWPVQGGAPTRMGDLSAYDAAWYPSGREVVYAKNNGVFLADRDGSHPRKLATTPGRPFGFAWSPDGRRLRFTVFPSGPHSTSLWEMNPDGSNLHQLFRGWNTPPTECCGSWSPDGSYFFFGAIREGVFGLWGIHEKNTLFSRSSLEPFQISTGQPTINTPILSTGDGHSFYATISTLKSELVSYSEKSRQFTTIFANRNADFVAYSRDGKWITYSSVPDNVLWREKVDGSFRAPLTQASFTVLLPVWSPKAEQIAFTNREPGCENKLYLISAEGGTPRALFPNECQQFDPNWTPDGKFLTFASEVTLPSGISAPSRIEMLDLANNRRSTVPGSEGMRGPSWSPDGQFLAAVTEDLHRVMLFKVGNKKWTELSRGTLFNGTLVWSRDGQYVYFQDLMAPNEPLYRLRVAGGHREQVLNFESHIRAGISRCSFVGVAPDASLIVSLLRNHADVHALQISFP
jgi:DNA-binding winged helix-turn-helix (wHTH) protein/Tol biopolymer transport system component